LLIQRATHSLIPTRQVLKLLLLHHTNDLKVIRTLWRASTLLRHKFRRYSSASILSGATRNRRATTIKLTTTRRRATHTRRHHSTHLGATRRHHSAHLATTTVVGQFIDRSTYCGSHHLGLLASLWVLLGIKRVNHVALCV